MNRNSQKKNKNFKNCIERHEDFSSQEIENYRRSIKQPKKSERQVKEEMLSATFAVIKMGRRIVEKIAEEKYSEVARQISSFKILYREWKKIFAVCSLTKEKWRKNPKVIEY